VSAQIPLAMRELLLRQAAEHERSLSGEIRVALRQHLQTSSAPGVVGPRTASGGSAARPEQRVRS
jgi:plasmid stability protein